MNPKNESVRTSGLVILGKNVYVKKKVQNIFVNVDNNFLELNI